MANNLVIVESPAKAKTIEKFLGKDFDVISCYGHIRDLPSGKMGVDTEDASYEPEYVISDDKKNVVKELKKLAKKAQEVWLATDEDREGEAISWHLCFALGLPPANTKRIVFHEITKNAIQEAIAQPRTVDENLVNAQQARRVLDRLVGFEISPILWRKVKPSLSAGRVQSVAVRLIVEREREIIDFKPVSSFKVDAEFILNDGTRLKATLARKLANRKTAEDFLESCKNAKYDIADIQVKPAKKSPSAPFTTSTLQQEASRKLGYSVSRTMVVAQKLYESGFITYMRTDSVNLSNTAIQAAKTFINKEYGSAYSEVRQFKTKSGSAQEAHEAIRPTDMAAEEIDAAGDEQRLYNLIWKRTMASQMSDAQLERTTVAIGISTNKDQFTAKGEVIKFDGFLKVYMAAVDEDVDEEESGLLPPLKLGQVLDLDFISATERFTKHPPRYMEASLVKKLEELGIGRPSTYAPTISTIQNRKYVEKTDRDGEERNYDYLELKDNSFKSEKKTEITGQERNKLFPTDIGILVNDFLTEHFQTILDYGFTADIEESFDKIAEGQLDWRKMIDRFYKPFHETVDETLENADRVTGERALGDDPKTGKPIIARMGKYGPMVQIGSSDDEEKPQFAKLRAGQHLHDITLEDALELFKLPRELGEHNGEIIKANEGRYGPYVQEGKVFASIPEDKDVMTISLEEALELLKERKEAAQNKVIMEYEDAGIQILRGPYGPYIKKGNRNYRIPKFKNAEILTMEECLEIIDKAPAKKGRRKGGFRKKKD